MEKSELCTSHVQKILKELTMYHTGWANDIREGWGVEMKGSREILFSLYEISGSIILSLQDVLLGRFHDKTVLRLVQQKLEKLITSEDFKEFDILGQTHACNVITNGTKHHIRVMLETLEVLTA